MMAECAFLSEKFEAWVEKQQQRCLWNQSFSVWTQNTLAQTGGPLVHFAWRFSVSISKKQPLVWANAFPKVLPNSACLFPMKNWEELCVLSGYRSSPGESSCWDHCATQDYGHQSIRITHTRAQYGQCISSEISLTTASGMERSVLSALSAAVWCVRLLRLSGAFFMHTAAALSIYEAFSVSVQRLFLFIWVKYNSYILIIAEYWNIMG